MDQDWCRTKVGSDDEAAELAGRFDEAGFSQDLAEAMFDWARKLKGSNADAIELVLEFNAKNVPDDYVQVQFAWHANW